MKTTQTTPVNVTDYVSETGDVVASYTYDAFGRTLSATGSMASVFPFRFSTKYYDAEANLYYYGYRYYSPELGRWLTRDPIEEDGGDNLYAFCGNNACASFDSFGKKCVVVSGPQIKTDAVWELEKIKFKSISDDGHTLLYGIYGYWRILGEVTCECKRFWSGKSCTIIKDVYKRKTPQNKEDYSAIDPDCHECFVDIPNPVALPIDIPLFTSIKEGFKEIIKSVLSEVLTKVFAEGGAILQPGVLQDISSAIMNDVPSSSDGKWPKKLCK